MPYKLAPIPAKKDAPTLDVVLGAPKTGSKSRTRPQRATTRVNPMTSQFPLGSPLLMKIFVAASIFLSATSANALQLLCHFHSFKDGALVDTLKITIGVDGGASVWHKWERTSYWDEHEKRRILW